MSFTRTHTLVVFCGVTLLARGCGTALGHGSLDQQIAALTEALAARPADPDLLLLRASAHRFHNDPPAAARDIAAAEEAGAPAGLTALARAELAVSQSDWVAAARELPALQSELPGHTDATRLAARIHTARGENADAATTWRSVVSRATLPRPEDITSLARALHASGADDEAIAALDAGARQIGEISVFHEEAARIEAARRRWDAALAHFDRLIAQSPSSPRWLAQKADLADLAARPDLALTTRRAALAALEALPPARRSTAAFSTLEKILRTQLTSPD